jgi:hypothetical protein
VEVAARLAVLVACAVAAGTLFVLLAAPGPARPAADPPHPAPLPGLVPAALAAFVLLAGGTALTGAGAVDPGNLSGALAVAGIAMLAIAGIPAGRAAVRILRASSAANMAIDPSPSLIALAWAGAALALASWLLAVSAVLVALLASLSVDDARP